MKKQSDQYQKALEQIQNELFVERESNKFGAGLLEIESATFKAPLQTDLAKSRTSSVAKTTTPGSSPCERIRSQKFVRRFKKVFAETLKFNKNKEEPEDIYVEVCCTGKQLNCI